LFLFFKPVRALTLAYLIGWLLLPVDSLDLKGFWDVDKILATNFGVILGTTLFCPKRFRSFPFGVPEVILLVYACGALATSLTNKLGLYDGVSSFTYKVFYTAVPFCFGRGFVRSRADLLEIARIIIYAAAAYTILALWEWRMMQPIHRILYGYFHHSFHQHMRWGHFRPVVCFPHTLAFGMFFAWTSLLAIAMYKSKQLPRLTLTPPRLLVILPLLGVLSCMSLGPWGLFAIGLGAYWLRRWRQWRLVIWAPMLIAFAWMGARYTGVVSGDLAIDTVKTLSAKRADSLETRIKAETLTIAHAKKRPAFGWGAFGRNRVRDARGKEVVTDGLWVILVGINGLVGLASFYLWWCWPIIISGRARTRLVMDPVIYPVLVAIGLQAVNLIFNGFVSPVLTMFSGACVTALYALRNPRPIPAVAEATSRRMSELAHGYPLAKGSQ